MTGTRAAKRASAAYQGRHPSPRVPPLRPSYKSPSCRRPPLLRLAVRNSTPKARNYRCSIRCREGVSTPSRHYQLSQREPAWRSRRPSPSGQSAVASPSSSLKRPQLRRRPSPQHEWCPLPAELATLSTKSEQLLRPAPKLDSINRERPVPLLRTVLLILLSVAAFWLLISVVLQGQRLYDGVFSFSLPRCVGVVVTRLLWLHWSRRLVRLWLGPHEPPSELEAAVVPEPQDLVEDRQSEFQQLA